MGRAELYRRMARGRSNARDRTLGDVLQPETIYAAVSLQCHGA